MEKQTVISALAALAQETRLDVFRALVQAGPQGLSAGAIGDLLDIPSTTLSFHLKELKASSLIQCLRKGRSRIYSPDFSSVNQLMAYLSANCCQGVDSSGCSVGGGDLDQASDAPDS